MDSPRTRAAAAWLPGPAAFLLPRQDGPGRARESSCEQPRGELSLPRLKWKYRPVEWLFGYDAAIRASSFVPRVKARTARKWDQIRSRTSTDLTASTHGHDKKPRGTEPPVGIQRIDDGNGN